MVEALDIHVKGIVQGVGFRPFVYRLAKKYLIKGWVLNAADGVHIRAEGEEKLLDEFVMEISEGAPAAAQVTEIEMKEVPLEPYDGFEIRTSDDAPAEEATLVSPDLATCADCARELFDPADRRFRYPFVNCTNCGPRFTIIDELPYDRARTSMSGFAMCDACQAEYDDPADRRFHAQPNACFACGPHLSFSADAGRTVRWGLTREESDAIVAEAVRLLCDGKIVAVKGLGGFHLACDANNADAVARLRERKHRFGKAFAVMMGSLDDVRQVCEVGVEEAAVLEGSARPIVLLRKQLRATLAPGVADGLPELGVMLPYTPLQHLLLHDFAEAKAAGASANAGINADAGGTADANAAKAAGAGTDACGSGSTNATIDASMTDAALPPMLVMTSGNVHDEPICIKDQAAYEQLAGIADAFVGNDREILTRFDDSVVRVIRAGSAGETVQMIRRARGYAPAAIEVKAAADGAPVPQPTIFAAGPEQKNTFCFLKPSDATGSTNDAAGASTAAGALAFVSQHVGDMENADAFDAWLEAKQRYERLFDLHANEMACDLHPEYITTKWAREQSALHRPPLPLVSVQHHHAHVASVIAECGLAPDEAVCGIAFDGTGYGVDGNVWGGEVLMANQGDFERFANFAYVPMPGGASAVKRPLQMAFGVLWEFDLLDHPGAAHLRDALGADVCANLTTMIDQGINTPVTSSVGRLFDAASALLGICTEPTYEGEPAILLEAALWEADATQTPSATLEDAYHIDVVKNVATETSTAHDTSVLLFDAAPAFRSLLDDFAADVPAGVIARRFHDAFLEAIMQAAQLSGALYDVRTVALSGGVFMNRYLVENALSLLEQAGFTVAINRELPPNDGCVSFGEAVIAWAQDHAIEED